MIERNDPGDRIGPGDRRLSAADNIGLASCGRQQPGISLAMANMGTGGPPCPHPRRCGQHSPRGTRTRFRIAEYLLGHRDAAGDDQERGVSAVSLRPCSDSRFAPDFASTTRRRQASASEQHNIADHNIGTLSDRHLQRSYCPARGRQWRRIQPVSAGPGRGQR